MHQTELEHLIEVTAQLKGAVSQLGDAYDAMPAIIEKEHRAIRAADFIAVQDALGAKENAGARVEECFTALMRASEGVARLRSDPSTQPRTLKECVAVLTEIAGQLTDDGIGAQVFRHQVNGLAHVVGEFDVRFLRIKPMIDANRYLVETMLHNMQESYRFWLDVAEQVATAYNAQGVQQTQGRNSGFTVKA